MISTDTIITNYLPYPMGRAVAEAWNPGADSGLVDSFLNRYISTTFHSKEHDIHMHSMTTTAARVIMGSSIRDHFRKQIVSMGEDISAQYLQAIYEFLQKAQHGVLAYDLAQRMKVSAETSPDETSFLGSEV